VTLSFRSAIFVAVAHADARCCAQDGVGCSFVHFEVDRDFIIAIIPDGTAGWRVATTALLSGDTLTLQGFHIPRRGPRQYRRGQTSRNGCDQRRIPLRKRLPSHSLAVPLFGRPTL